MSRPDLGEARFTCQHVTANTAEQKDALTAFMVSRSVAANAVTRAAWDYQRLAGTAATDASALDIGVLPTLEVYDGSGAYRYENMAQAKHVAALELVELALYPAHFTIISPSVDDN